MAIYMYRTKSGKIRYRVRVYDGYRVVKTGTFPTKELARQFEAKWEVEVATAKLLGVKHHRLTFTDFWNKVYLPMKKNKLNPSTLKTYKHIYFANIEPVFGNKMMSDLQTEEILRYFVTLEARYSRVFLNKIRQVLNLLYNLGIKLQYFTTNPIAGVPEYSEPAAASDYKWWQIGNVQKFLDWCRESNCPRYLMYKMVLEEGGMRPSEVIALKRDQVNLDLGWYRVCRSYNRTTRTIQNDTKTYLLRTIGLSEKMVEALRCHLAQHQSEFLFTNKNGTHYQYEDLRDQFKKDCQQAGVPNIGLNGMRHTFASHYMMTIGNEIALTKIMGHSSTKMLQRYVHLTREFIIRHSGRLDFEAMGKNVHPFPHRDSFPSLISASEK